MHLQKPFVLAVAVFLLGGGAGQAETLKVAIPQRGNWATMIADYGQREGFFKAEGLELDEIFTPGGAQTEQAVISGSVDLAMGTGLLGIISAYVKGAPVRVISAEMTGSGDLYWYAKAESGIHSLKDAQGKTAAFSVAGSSTNLVLLALLRQAKVDARAIGTGDMPTTMTQVMSGQIDIGYAGPPVGLQQVQEGKLVIVARGNDVPEIRDETVRVNVVNAKVLQSRRDAILRFARAYDKTLTWAYSDPRAIDYLAADNNVPRAIAQVSRDDFYPRTALQPYEIRGLDRALQEALDAKRIPAPMTAQQVAGMIDIVYKPTAP